MKLNVRYDDIWEVLELDDKDTEGLWISLDLEGEGLSKEEKEEKIQEAFDEQFNRPDYNSMHKFDRHRGYSSSRSEDGTLEKSEPKMNEVRDSEIFWREEILREKKIEYEAVCDEVRSILRRKPNWAEAFIAIRLDGMSVNDYAASIGLKDASAVSHWLVRAEKKLAERYPKTSENHHRQGYESETPDKGGREND